VYSSVSFPDPGFVLVVGDLTTSPNDVVDVLFYGSPTCDPSGHGEGQVYLGSLHTTSNSYGWVNFTIHRPITEQVVFFTATAYSLGLGQSEFSPCIAASIYLPVIMR
jgi:hypothetical protein